MRPSEFKRIQAKYGRDSIGAITSSRCTAEEVLLIQKLVRAGFGNNNVDTCARVCHSPTGYGLSQTYGTSAGTQDFKSVDDMRRDAGHRRQPDRRASRVRLAHEEAAARRREAHRRRSAPHRSRQDAAHVEAAIISRSGPARMSPSSTRSPMSSSPRGWLTKPSSRSAAIATISRAGRASSRRRNIRRRRSSR